MAVVLKATEHDGAAILYLEIESSSAKCCEACDAACDLAVNPVTAVVQEPSYLSHIFWQI